MGAFAAVIGKGGTAQASWIDGMLAAAEAAWPQGKRVSALGVAGRAAAGAIELQDGGSARLCYEDDQVLVACDAEIYNAADLDRSAAGEAALIAGLYKRHGEDWHKSARGQFGVFLWDKAKEIGYAWSDPLGIRPVTYYEDGSRVAVATRLSSLAALPGFESKQDPQALFSYLFLEFIPTPFTLYRAARKLEGGHMLRIAKGGVTVSRFWNMRYPAEKLSQRSEMEEGMRRLMRASVERRITHRAPALGDVGSFLSGGTDSSLIAGMVSHFRPGEARTFSIGFRENGYDEMEYARIAAKAFSTKADEFYVSQQDIIDSLPAITRAFGEPFANSSVVPTYFCAMRAKAAGCKFILGGDGGDEIFGGNSRYVENYKNFSRYPAWFEALMGAGLAMTPDFAKRGPLRQADNYLKRKNAPLHERIHAYDLSVYIPDLGNIFAPGFLEGTALETPQATAKRILDQAEAADELDEYLYFDLKSAIMDNDLRKVNAMTELAGVEARFPFLDLDLVEFTGRIPADLKVHQGKLRYLYKETFKDILPDEIVNKKKHGFGLPVVRWMLRDGNPMHAWLRDVLFDGKLKARGIFRQEFVDDLYKRARADKTPYFGAYLYYIFALELWMREQERSYGTRTRAAAPAGAGRDLHG